MAFVPNVVAVPPSQPISIAVRSDSGTHDLVLELGGGQVVFTPVIFQGQSFALKFTSPATPGEYPFYCSVANHRALGMTGRLIVVPNESPTPTGSATPDGSPSPVATPVPSSSPTAGTGPTPTASRTAPTAVASPTIAPTRSPTATTRPEATPTQRPTATQGTPPTPGPTPTHTPLPDPAASPTEPPPWPTITSTPTPTDPPPWPTYTPSPTGATAQPTGDPRGGVVYLPVVQRRVMFGLDWP